MKKSTIVFIVISLVLNVLLGGGVYYFLKDSNTLENAKKELKLKNEKLDIEIGKLKLDNVKLDEIKKVKENTIVILEIENEKLNVENKKLESVIKKVNSFKKSKDFIDLNDCKKNFEKFRLNCANIEKQNLVLKLKVKNCEDGKDVLNDIIDLKDRKLENKDIIIENLGKKIVNTKESLKKFEIAMKKPKFFKTAIKVIVGVCIGYAIGKSKIL